MKFVILFAALFAVCAALPLDPDASAVVLREARVNDGISGYQFNYETSNGINRDETGVLKPVGEVGVIVVNGGASWTSPEGIPVSFKFSADENGYQPIV